MTKNILISRTDAIGDVVLTLPMCGYLKRVFPEVCIFFLGRSYTSSVIKACSAIDQFVNYDDFKNLDNIKQVDYLKSKSIDAIIHVHPNRHLAQLAKKAGIPLRIGTTNRFYHWLTCNNLVKLSRKNAGLHEAELNLVLLKGLGINRIPNSDQLFNYYNFGATEELYAEVFNLLSEKRFNLLLHPKSNGSGKEWSLKHYQELISLLPQKQFKIFITGSEKEMPVLNSWIKSLDNNVIDLTGRFDLGQLIAFLQHADGMIASGTGPLHLAAAAGINTLGLFPISKSINAKRWSPIGKKAQHLESMANDLDTISALTVYEKVKFWNK
ncbi:MAG: glycosyltransferase family 9 protein [Sphingobacteriaceae bacterium]